MIPVIFEDEAILVLNKPPGLIVDNSDTDSLVTLENILRDELGITVERSGIVHRLDKDTSGLLLVAKTSETFKKLQEQFQNRTVKKEYLALVHGMVKKPGRIKASIIRNPKNREKFTAVLPGRSQSPLDQDSPRGVAGKEAETEYTPSGNLQFSIYNFQLVFNVLKKIEFKKLQSSGYNSFSLLTCHPLTGRTHQIRVHLKYISHPIVGDARYVGRKTARVDKLWCPRQFLHAKALEFDHPVMGKRVSFGSELPDDLQKVLDQLEVQ